MTKLKRFWSEVGVIAGPDGHVIALDAMPLNTPAGARLALPTAAAAELVAGEWRTEADEIDPFDMQLTRLANVAIDRVTLHRDDVVWALSAYAETDLLCHRADGPESLRLAEAQTFEPLLAWARHAFGIELRVAEGIVALPQPEASLASVGAYLAPLDVFALTGLQVAASITSSIVVPIALREGRIDAEEAFAVAFLDELWQAGRWGQDAEAEDRRAGLKGELQALDAWFRALATAR